MSKTHHQHHFHHHYHNQESLRARVGKYELGRVLGEGSFCKVKFARNIETGQCVSIKILEKEWILKNKLVEQIKREVSTMKLVKHPNVIQMYEIMASKTKIYFVLEYVMGGELFSKITQNGRLREDEARKYFQQLINAVDYCHSRGVYHRDLKPENLLLDKDGNLKVSGFGLSALPQQLREDGLLHTTCGTPNYVAPEVFTDKGYDGAKADIWSCGIILFVLIAGYLPFDESNLMNLYRKIHKAEFVFPHWFSSKARKLITRILNPNPSLRITIQKIMQASWFRKGYMPAQFVEISNINLDDVETVFNDAKEQDVVDGREEKVMKPTFFNAFELIGLSKGLNLSGLFEEKQALKQDLHFVSKHPASEIIKKMEETAKPLGFIVQTDSYKMKLQGAETGRKGHLCVATEVFEVAPSFFMVKVKKDGGDTLEYQNFYRNFSRALKDIVWKNEADVLD